jgi:hypothetical protein
MQSAETKGQDQRWYGHWLWNVVDHIEFLCPPQKEALDPNLGAIVAARISHLWEKCQTDVDYNLPCTYCMHT